MKIKTFQALTMSDAIRTIKDELGPDAVILSSKQVRKSGGVFGLFGQPMIEVAAAVDLQTPAPSQVRAQAKAARQTERTAVPQRPLSKPGTAVYAKHESPALEPPPWERRHRAPEPEAWGELAGEPKFDETLRRQMARTAAESAVINAMPVSTPAQGLARYDRPERRAAETDSGDLAGIKDEITQLRRLVEEMRQANAGAVDMPARPTAAPPVRVPQAARTVDTSGMPSGMWERWQDRLRQSGLDAERVRRIVTSARQMTPPAAPTSDQAARQALHRVLSREITVAGPLFGMGEWKKAVIFTGPTGVGKTTTIAKLAAHYRLKEKRSVALITLDTYRVAAVEQLRMYAQVLGVSMDVALTKREAVECIKRRSKTELLLIDTAGRSPRDEAGMQELRELIAVDHPLETHLVLSATTKEQDLRDGWARYAALPVDRLLFTKLDETTGFGGLADLALSTGVPLSYFSTGQRVPEDIEVARPERVADLVLDGEIAAAPHAAGTAR